MFGNTTPFSIRGLEVVDKITIGIPGEFRERAQRVERRVRTRESRSRGSVQGMKNPGIRSHGGSSRSRELCRCRRHIRCRALGTMVRHHETSKEKNGK